MDMHQKLADLSKAMEPTEEQNLSWGELANILGVQPNKNGNLCGIELFNACRGVQDNLRVQNLPLNQRLQVIRSAADALVKLRSGKVE